MEQGIGKAGRGGRPAARIRVRLAPCAAAAAFLAAAPAGAQTATGDPATAELLRLNLLEVRLSFFDDVTVWRAGAEVDAGWLCGYCDAIFAGSPAAVDAASTFATMRIAGIPLYVLGLGALLVDAALAPLYPEVFFNDENAWAPFLSLLVGGTVVGVVGGMLIQGARSYLVDAVGAYNADVFAAVASGRGLPLTGGVVPVPGGAALGFSGRL
jgi:hypothetical protein